MRARDSLARVRAHSVRAHDSLAGVLARDSLAIFVQCE